MQISELLNNKHGPAPNEVISCGESEFVSAALGLMTDNNIGAVVVTRNGDVVGVYSERDVVKNCQKLGMDFRVCTLGEMMSSNVIKIRPDQSVDEALQLMRDNRIRHLPVLDNETMVGFLSLRDLMNAKLDYANKKAEVLKDQMLNIDKPLPM